MVSESVQIRFQFISNGCCYRLIAQQNSLFAVVRYDGAYSVSTGNDDDSIPFYFPFDSMTHFPFKYCPIEESRSDNQTTVVWDPVNRVSPLSIHTIRGKPLCLNEIKFPVYRNCALEWSPLEAPMCNYVQTAFEDDSALCPANYIAISMSESKTFCVFLSQPMAWQNTCSSDGAHAIFYDLNGDEKMAVLHYLRQKDINEVWMPAKRSSKFGSVIWMLSNNMYGDTVEFDELHINLEEHNNLAENGCFSATAHSNFRFGAIQSCATQLPHLCIYNAHAERLIQLACPKNFYTTPFGGKEQLHCYSRQRIEPGITKKPTDPSRSLKDRLDFTLTEEWIDAACQGGNLMTINSSMKVAVMRQLATQLKFPAKDRCLFAVADGNMYVKEMSDWANVAANAVYVNWNYPIRDGHFLTTDVMGKWNWINESFKCMLCELSVDMQTPVLALNFDEAKGRLYLTVYSQEFLWRKSSDEAGIKCFTNADYALVRTVKVNNKKWAGILNGDDTFSTDSNEQSRTISKTVYELKLYGDGPGYYWCHGHAIPDLRQIDSPKIVAHRRLRGDVFATLITTVCERCERLFLTKQLRELARDFREYLRNLYRSVKQQFQNKIDIENVRAMQIDDIQPKKQARILFHITVSSSYDFDNSENAVNISVDQFRIYKIKEILMRVLSSAQSPRFTFISLNSTGLCLPDTLRIVSGQLSWISATIGEITAPRELCLLNDGLPVLRQCVGDFLYGGVWRNLTRQQCHSDISNITRQLYEVNRLVGAQSNHTPDAIDDVERLFRNSSSEKFVPADVFYLGRLMQTILHTTSGAVESDAFTTPSPQPLSPSPFHSQSPPPMTSEKLTMSLNKTNIESICSIYNSLMYLNENTTRISAALNSTNILLDAFDNIINGLPMNLTASHYSHHNRPIVRADDGTIAMQTPKLIVYVIDPFVRNVSGIALIKRTMLNANATYRDDFTDYDVRLLYANQTPLDLLNEGDLEIAAFVPQNLLDRLNETIIPADNVTQIDEMSDLDAESMPSAFETLPRVRIVVSVFYNDLLFQEYKNVTYAKSAGRIISVSIPGYGRNLPALMPIYVKSNVDSKKNDTMCGYWNFRDTVGWSDDGCEYWGKSNATTNNESIVLCACSHLTHFSYLVMGTYVHTIRNDDDFMLSNAHHATLDMITLLGCSLSLLGILGIAITAVVFPTWREKASSKVLT